MARVLIVDDNEALADDLAELLEDEGHHTTSVYGGEQALKRAAEFSFDAALVDIRMPGMDGVTLVRRLMGGRPSATYLFMTGFSEDRLLSEAMALSAQAALTKPLDISRLTRLLSAV